MEQQLSDAITAMHNQDSDLAKRVIEGDKNVNMMEVAIDEALSLIHISEPTRRTPISYAVFCLKKKKKQEQKNE